eukprot:365952-Chlamydomonas_euryale.AAC.2
MVRKQCICYLVHNIGAADGERGRLRRRMCMRSDRYGTYIGGTDGARLGVYQRFMQDHVGPATGVRQERIRETGRDRTRHEQICHSHQ